MGKVFTHSCHVQPRGLFQPEYANRFPLYPFIRESAFSEEHVDGLAAIVDAMGLTRPIVGHGVRHFISYFYFL
jgi:hypothetical protein